MKEKRGEKIKTKHPVLSATVCLSRLHVHAQLEIYLSAKYTTTINLGKRREDGITQSNMGQAMNLFAS